MITSITKSNQLPVAHVATPLAPRKKAGYKWYNIIIWSLVFVITVVVWVGLGFLIRKYEFRLTFTKTVVFKKGGQL
ncbi:hypothetical protein BWI93_02750 [Siphonobacter sp. BAB-5385]|uniref:hypothetical protein n=1 Tax=Siphonobacter sp. BAB-5385 TaxID=1864822 RepID=UPI000B9E5B9C|nr:hypothetical protein [Siphonobacter sp. BAB-5385]OZI09662.1 hypothetical protein BWI93_02750 [Siphonobacter sp. BAB-5385]